MLNTKYIIDEDGTVQENNSALGNAWFVNSVQIVENADQELLSLNNFSPKDMAIVDKRFENDVYKNLFSNKGVIDLLEYKPNYLKYKSESNVNGIAVFSEVYYDKGWNAYIDGEIQPHFRANYILRALNVPAGNHIIEFKFEPNLYKKGETVSLASSLILILLLAFLSFKELRYK